MSKRQDDPDVPDIEEGMTTAERRRKRRRGAGLRVPSDNVPRRSAAVPVVAPIPEDPNLAVSIAYSFGSDASQPVPRPPSDGSFAEAEAEAAELMAAPEVRDGVLVPMAHPAIPMNAATAAAVAEVARLDAIAAEGNVDGKTREMPAVQLEELGLEVPEFMNESGGARDTVVVDLEEARRPTGGRASTVALSDDDLEEMRAGLSGPSPAPAATKPPTAQLAAFDDHSGVSLPVVKFRAESDVSGGWTEIEDPGRDTDERAATDPVAAAGSSAPEGEEVALDDADLQDEVVQPGDASDSGEILTEELLEEVETQSAAPVPLKAAPAEVAPVAAAPAAATPVAAAPAPASAPAPAKEAVPVAVAKEPAAAAVQAAKPPPAPAVAAKPPPAPPKKASAARAAAAVAAAVAPGESRDARDERRRRAKPWFEEIFDEDYLRTLPFLTPQATQSEAQFVIEALGLQAGAQVLDLGCGYGRHAMELAARGYHMVGLDLSLPLLLRGADEAQRRGLTINFVHGDMRELDFDSQFDGAYCVFSTFGFFDDETNKKTAANLARALKPGARVVLDILNRDYLIADLPTRVWWEGDGCVVLEEVEFNYFSSRIQCNRSVVFDDGRQVEQEISMRAYSLHEIGKLLHAAGFRVIEISGSMVTRGRFFGGTSRQIIVVAERRPKDPKEGGKEPNGAGRDKDEVTKV